MDVCGCRSWVCRAELELESVAHGELSGALDFLGLVGCAPISQHGLGNSQDRVKGSIGEVGLRTHESSPRSPPPTKTDESQRHDGGYEYKPAVVYAARSTQKARRGSETMPSPVDRGQEINYRNG